MADKKISELVSAAAFAPADIVPIVQGGANKKITFANIFNFLNTPVSANTLQADIDFKYSGVLVENLFFVDASADRVGIRTNTPEEDLDVNGSLSSNGIERSKSFNTQTSSGQVSLTSATTIIDSISPVAATLPVGKEGQKKTIILKGPGSATLTGTGFGGFTTVTFNSIGDTLTLMYIDSAWYVINGYGVVIA